MDKTISFETTYGIVEIRFRESGDYFAIDEVSLSKDSIMECLGIWKDESVFVTEGEHKLRMPTEVLIGLLNVTRQLVNNKETSWWKGDEALHKRLKDLVK